MIQITTDKTRIDVDAVHQFLSRSYWAAGIPRELVERSIEHSVCVAALDEDATVGFARVITDHATFAYLADVFVLLSHRGRGISRMLMSAIAADPSLQGLRRWLLVTRDAHGVYAKFGFTPLAAPERVMEKVVKDAYRVRA